MDTQKLIGKLDENHIKFNQTVENYEENGVEDFEEWFRHEYKKYLKINKEVEMK